jgi:C-terminal processing protease CtpA/Prc
MVNIKSDKPTVVAFLKETEPNHFDFISNRNGAIYTFRNLVYINKRLSSTPYKKYEGKDFVSIPSSEEKYQFRRLNQKTDYLRLGTFSSNNKKIAIATSFYESIKDSLTAKNVIVDLRDNTGGGFKTSQQFIKLLKKHMGNIHILVNNFTVSNAEQFVNELKDKSNVTTYGETTRGTLCYGNNRGTSYTLPSNRFVFYPTDMKARKKDLPFESIGSAPDVELNPFSGDWIKQTLDLIKTY